MAVTESELNEALTRAASLMSSDGRKKIEQARKQNSGNFDNNGEYIKPFIPEHKTQTQSMNIRRNSGLPKAILESITNNPIEDFTNEYSTGGSVLDSIGYTGHVVKETRTAQVEPQQYIQTPTYVQQPVLSIDYNYIKAIVNECVQNSLKQIKEEIINESTLKAIKLGAENKIQLIDNKNNLYESKLEFKRNLSKK